MTNEIINKIVQENAKRNAEVYAKFDPISGKGSVGERERVRIKDFPVKVQYLPVEMMNIPLVKRLIQYGSIDALLKAINKEEHNSEDYEYPEEDYEVDRLKVFSSLFVCVVGTISLFGLHSTFTSRTKEVEKMSCFVSHAHNADLSKG